MKNVDKLKNQASTGAEQKRKNDKTEKYIPETFLVIVPFGDKTFYRPSFPSFLTPSLLACTSLNTGYEQT
ncbi:MULTISPECIES: hypothetical protein [Enterococcus]|uniref:hypothetical protein n=1 Tax=Enterococcus TaxID=1350 RepID=UPI001788BEF1|nr:hypothetical protein [Enterococcus avium]HAP3020824.1 hypothetical protein [Enterococcus faecalis]HBI1561737.1 hypothetical protein [Enterococcus faecalis]HBI1564785.1 hypothetical protein [Enterococcus faecalis]HBI1717948.1 hypothetical protein [Enterococcus faecalis]HBI1720801.1 hypothetical protein [Enterococcus faecalis]